MTGDRRSQHKLLPRMPGRGTARSAVEGAHSALLRLRRNLDILWLNPDDLTVTPRGNGISRLLVADKRLAHASRKCLLYQIYILYALS